MNWFDGFEQRRFAVNGSEIFKPIELWQAQCAGRVTGECMPAGHFIPEELHRETAQALRAFFS